MKNPKELEYQDHISLHFTCDSFFEDMKVDKKENKRSLFSSEASTIFDLQDERKAAPSASKRPIAFIIEEMQTMDRMKVSAPVIENKRKKKKRNGRKKRTLRMARVVARFWVHYFKLI